MGIPFISVVMPVYNCSDYLRQSLDSVVNQSLEDIEIICVDDCSRDGSLEIISEYAEKDRRLQIICNEKNEGALSARTKGVLAAKGRYTLFLDADDYLSRKACEELYGIAEEHKVDVLAHSYCFFECDAQAAPESGIHMDPQPELITRDPSEIKSLYFLRPDSRKRTTLWGKLYNTDILKSAHKAVMKDYRGCGEDIYESFLISYYAKSIEFAVTEPLYFYCKGRGISGRRLLNLTEFERYCQMGNLVESLKAFLQMEGTFEENKTYWSSFKQRLLEDCYITCAERIKPDEYDEAVDMMKKYWGSTMNDDSAIKGLLSSYNTWYKWARELESGKEWMLKQLEYKDQQIKNLRNGNLNGRADGQ